MPVVEVRRIRRDDAVRFKSIRLAALADAPTAFAATFAEEAAYPPSRWVDAACDRSSGDTDASFLALVGDTAVGLVGVFRPDADDEVMQLVSMWVEPTHRGSGVAEQLVDHVLDFVTAAGGSAVELWVTVGNDRARRFYERMGFEPLDDFAPLPSDPCKDEQRMRQTL